MKVHRVNQYSVELDTNEINHLKVYLENEHNGLPIEDFKKTKPLLTYGSFIEVNLSYVPRSESSHAFYISRNGWVEPTTKKLLDSLFLKGFEEANFLIPFSEIPGYYRLLSAGGKDVSTSDDLIGFRIEEKQQFESTISDLKPPIIDNLNDSLTTVFTYNRSFRTIYEYIFYHNETGVWSQPPKISTVMKDVGPLNYFR